LHGRFEILQKDPLVILDVGHHPSGISATVETLRNYRRGKVVLVFGVMADKAYRPMIRSLALLRPLVFAVRPEMERALPAETITALFREKKCKAQSFRTVGAALAKAVRTQKRKDVLLICGSHYVADEALECMRKHLRPKKS
jgi:dihydrofolate synthase / folylpolyglutamate synthase